MIKISALALAAGLAMTGASLAQAATPTGVAGKWTYKIGSNTTCSLTLTTNATGSAGDAAPGENCPGGLNAVGHWRAVGSNLHLMSPAGDLVASLHHKGDGYVGRQISGGRKVALSR